MNLDKYHLDRPTGADVHDQNVYNARREKLQPTKVLETVAPSRTYSEYFHAKPKSVQLDEIDEEYSKTKQNTNITIESSRTGAEKSDVSLFRRALIENRMPTPKQLEFDGNPKTFKAFLASFKTNIESKLNEDTEDDAALKLTYLLQHCTGDAKYLIEDCAMLDPFIGFDTAMERLQERYGQGHVIARSFIESVTKGPTIKLNDVAALTKLQIDMVKCQSVLSRLEFTSDLDSTGTLASIIVRLPDSFQLKWARRSTKILQGGRDTKFSDLVAFVKEECFVYNSKFGQMYAESKSSHANQANDAPNNDKPKRSTITTLATSGESASSTTGLSSSSAESQKHKPHCDHCDLPGHFIGRCFKFKKLKRDDKLQIVENKNLCFCCLKSAHQSKDCERRCIICDKGHHVLIHGENDERETSSAD